MKPTFLTLLLCLFVFASCADKDLYQPGPDPEPEIPPTYTTVKFSIDGELSIITNPIEGRAANAGTKDLYGIAVAMLVKEKNSDTYTQKPYAYGIFDEKGVTNLELNLIDGYKYYVSATAIINGQDSLDINKNGKFARPFTTDRNGEVYGEITNKFVVAEQPDGSIKYLYRIGNAEFGTSLQSGISRCFVKRYHGTIEELDITKSTNHPITLYRRHFAVQFTANGLRTGEVRVQLDDSPEIILTPGKTVSDYTFVSLKSMTGKIEEGKEITDVAAVTASMYAPGQDSKLIIDRRMSFARKSENIITLHDIDNMGTDSGITIQIETGDLTIKDPIDIPWQSEN